MKNRYSILTGLIAGTLLAGCASVEPAPREQMAVARAAVERSASPAAAEAPAEVSMAREKLSRAEIAMTREEYDLARRLAEEAEADATLAEAKARSIRSDRALQEVREGIRQLRQEITRRNP